MENNGCIDIPDDRDYTIDDLVGGDIPSFVLPEYTVYNQGGNPKTNMGCTRYALGVPANIQNIMEFQKAGLKYEEVDPKEYWFRAVKNNPNIERFGDSLQNALKQLKSEGVIKGYVKVTSLEKAMSFIRKGHQIYTGVNGVSRSETKKSGIMTTNINVKMGHAIFLVGEENDYIVAQNSYGKSRGKSGNGTFLIKKTDREKLFSKYIIIDKETVTPIRKRKLAEAIIKNIDELLELASNETVIKELIEAKVILKKHGF